MNNKEISKIALKVFSIYALVQALLIVPQQFYYYLNWSSNSHKYADETWLILISIVSVILLLMVSALIWKLSNKITNQINQEPTTQCSNINEASALSVLGLFIVFFALFKLAANSISIYYLINISEELTNNVKQGFAYLAIYCITLILGVSLIIKANGWLALIKKFQTMGSK